MKNSILFYSMIFYSILSPIYSEGQEVEPLENKFQILNNKTFDYQGQRRDLYLEEIKVRWKKAALENCPVVSCPTKSTIPTISTISISAISANSSVLGGNVISEGGASVTSRGVVWSTSTNPTVSLSTKTTDGSGIGSFTSNITSLVPNTTYYFRAYGTNSIGTGYGNEISITTNSLCSGCVHSATGKIWMDRNLGASQVATSSTDNASYGDLYQWGRGTDGHQLSTSGITNTLSGSDSPGHPNFIRHSTFPDDWRSPQNDNLWQGVNGINNPCPSGFRLPTYSELDAERAIFSSQDAAGAFASVLKLPIAHYRSRVTGGPNGVNIVGNYWSSTVTGNLVQQLGINSSSAFMGPDHRSNGMSVRCIKD
jgi:uncharacterized protein (TIGR02145 family)